MEHPDKSGDEMEEKTDRELLIEVRISQKLTEETLLGKLGANGKKGLMERVRVLEAGKKWIMGISSSIFLMLAIMFLKDIFGG